ncbi:MAG: hypothetical protein EZS28_036767, partial [Streblomastix strix]
MKHLEHCIGKHVNPDVSKCDELKNLPDLVQQLKSEQQLIRLNALDNILKEIGTVQMELCRAEQFSELFDQLSLLIKDISSPEAEKSVSIIELLSTQHLNMVLSEKQITIDIFKEKQLGKLIKEIYQNEKTPALIKESAAYSIFEWETIENAEDPCFKPILDFLQEKLKSEEDRLELHPYNSETEQKRNKYGLTTLESILDAFCVYSYDEEQLQQELYDRGGIQIGIRYINHPSAKVRVSATCLLYLITDQSVGSEFRKNNDCLSIINNSLPIPQLKVVSSIDQQHIPPCIHIPKLHTGLISNSGLCINCDLQPSSDQTKEQFDLNYRIIRNQLCAIRDFIYNDPKAKKNLILQMREKRLKHLRDQEKKEKMQQIDEYDEDNSAGAAYMRVFEDFEEGGLFESAQSQ